MSEAEMLNIFKQSLKERVRKNVIMNNSSKVNEIIVYA